MNRLTWTEAEARPLRCKVCDFDGEGTSVAVVRTRAGREIEAVRCPQCGSLDLVDDPADGMPTDREVDDYVEVGAGISTITHAFDGVDPATVARFLDVGCGYGFALDVARFEFGWTVVGVEPSLSGRRGAAELDLDIRSEYLQADSALGEPFDLILASEVIEHVVDPLAFLTTLHARLRSTGILLVTTPAAEVVVPASAEQDALCALSPGYHTFVATASALTELLRRAGFTSVQVTRSGWSLRATASMGATPTASGVPPVARGELAYLRDRMGSAPEGSSLAVGMSTRLLRQLVAGGRLDEADDVAKLACAAFRTRHDLDLNQPDTVREQFEAGHAPPWSAVGAAFALGSLDLHLHGNPQRAADYFELASRLAAFWMGELDIIDLDLADLHFQGAFHRALAQTRFAPADAIHAASVLHESVSPSQPGRDDLLDTSLCRLFVELVAQGHRQILGEFVDYIQALAAPTARSDDDLARVAGLDALYSLGVVRRDAGDLDRAQAAFLECIGICDSRPNDDHHAAQLGQLCRANLPQAPEKESAPVKARKDRRLFRRNPLPRPSSAGLTSFIDTYWSDTWGTYLDGWASMGGTPIEKVTIEAGGTSYVASPQARPDLDDRHHGFAIYLPGQVSFPITLVVQTASGEAAMDISLAARPRPEHPATPPALPDRRLQRAMKHAPDGPALALGVRSLSEELAVGRIAILGEREVVGLDIHPGYGVDVVGDVHQLSRLFPRNHFSVIYSAALLEHVAAPWLVAAECAKVLKPGGIAVHLAPWVWPTHSQPNDFWRFSDRGLAALFHESLGFRVLECGGSGGAIITPTPDWRAEQLRFPTYSSPAMSWVIAEKVAEPDASIAWPYSDADVETAQEYPVDGLCDSARVAP